MYNVCTLKIRRINVLENYIKIFIFISHLWTSGEINVCFIDTCMTSSLASISFRKLNLLQYSIQFNVVLGKID